MLSVLLSQLTAYFNPRSLTGATQHTIQQKGLEFISIHAPLRERRLRRHLNNGDLYFNPRSLTGATSCPAFRLHPHDFISIHAPLRERPLESINACYKSYISIHAPLRERRPHRCKVCQPPAFQSTLPYGSDLH